MPCYNQEELILETLESIHNQTFLNWECLVINDGSSDNSKQIIENYVSDKSKFRLINQINKGVSGARNEGVKQSQGTYIVFLDGDDRLSYNYLEETYNAITNNSEIKLVNSKIEYFDEVTGEWVLPPYNYSEMLIDSMLHPTFLFKRADFLKTTGFDETMRRGIEDWEFLIRFMSPSDKVMKLESVTVFYRMRNVSRNNSLSKQEMQSLKNYIYQKNIDKYVAVLGDYIELYKSKKAIEHELQLLKNSKQLKISKKIINIIRKLNIKNL